MATFKFFNIGKANEEISRLESELTKAQAEAKAANENAAAVEANAEATAKEFTQCKADLETAKASIATVTARAEKAEADLKVANEKLANPNDQIKAAASRKALEITQAQGQPPVTAGAAAPGQGDILAQYNAIKDSTEKVVFYRKNKAAIDAAFSALRKGNA